MGNSVGAWAVFGILLSKRPEVADIYKELKEFEEYDVSGIEDDDFNSRNSHRKFQRRFIERLKEHGIVVPSKAKLHYTDFAGSRIDECNTPAEEWVIGFDLTTNPWEFPRMHASFKRAASWHTWA